MLIGGSVRAGVLPIEVSEEKGGCIGFADSAEGVGGFVHGGEAPPFTATDLPRLYLDFTLV